MFIYGMALYAEKQEIVKLKAQVMQGQEGGIKKGIKRLFGG